MSSTILQGSVFDLLPTITRGSVDCVVTSPPYWRLRSYLPQSHALKPLELGSEKTPPEFVKTMVRVFGLVRETMAEHAVCFINCGDTYATGGGADQKNANKGNNGRTDARNGRVLDDGNLCLIPQRLAIALQDDGWYVRSVIAWHKPAPMPGSMSGWRWERCRVKEAKQKLARRSKEEENGDGHYNSVGPDWAATWSPCPGCPKCAANDGYVLRRGRWRPTSAWEPILMLAKSEKYFCDGEACKQKASSESGWAKQRAKGIDTWSYNDSEQRIEQTRQTVEASTFGDGLANLRDVWTIAAEPLHYFCFRCMASCRADGKTRKCPRCGDKVHTHFAAFPTELVYRCLASGTSSRGYCTQCGLPWVRMVETNSAPIPEILTPKHADKLAMGLIGRSSRTHEPGWRKRPELESKTLGWKPSCRCNADARPGLVLDPFAGSGRTGIQCARMGLDFVGIELSPDNAAMARALIREEMPLFA